MWAFCSLRFFSLHYICKIPLCCWVQVRFLHLYGCNFLVWDHVPVYSLSYLWEEEEESKVLRFRHAELGMSVRNPGALLSSRWVLSLIPGGGLGGSISTWTASEAFSLQLFLDYCLTHQLGFFNVSRDYILFLKCVCLHICIGHFAEM